MVDVRMCTKAFENNRSRYIDTWKKFLTFPSISTDPAYQSSCLDCAKWLSGELGRMGFTTELLETSGKPVVWAERKGKPGAPTVLYYGHYDVQPVDPLDQWLSPPFEPTLRDDRIYARGAEDNKGQTAYVLSAIEYLISQNALQCTLKICIEGEEETGSKGISHTIPSWSERLKADVLMVCDTGVVPTKAPTITMGLRGLCGCTVSLTGATHDLHSGVHGGVALNAASAMCRLVASLHSPDGSIAVEGYYDAVVPPTKEDFALANEFVIPAEMYEKLVGVKPLGGERSRSIVDRRGFRPTIEINGVHSGYGGPGSKTIIPNMAIAKITARLAGGQVPDKSLALIERHLEKHTPEGLKLEISQREIAGPALSLSSASAPIKKAREALVAMSDMTPVFMWEGASIPIIPLLVKHSGAEPVLVGFGDEEDKIHAPNESFGIDQYRKGFLYASLFLGSF